MRIKVIAAFLLLVILATILYCFVFSKPDIATLAANIESSLKASKNIEYKNCTHNEASITLTEVKTRLPVVESWLDIDLVTINSISAGKANVNLRFFHPDHDNSPFTGAVLKDVQIKKILQALSKDYKTIKPSELGLGQVSARIKDGGGLLNLKFNGKKAELLLTNQNLDSQAYLGSFQINTTDIDSGLDNLLKLLSGPQDFNTYTQQKYAHTNLYSPLNEIQFQQDWKKFIDLKTSQFRNLGISKIELQDFWMDNSFLPRVSLKKFNISNVNELTGDVLIENLQLGVGESSFILEKLKLEQLNFQQAAIYFNTLNTYRHLYGAEYYMREKQRNEYRRYLSGTFLHNMLYHPYSLKSIELGTIRFETTVYELKLDNFIFNQKPQVYNEKVTNSNSSFNFEIIIPDFYTPKPGFLDLILRNLKNGSVKHDIKTDTKNYITHTWNVECKDIFTMNLTFTLNNLKDSWKENPTLSFDRKAMLDKFRLEIKYHGLKKTPDDKDIVAFLKQVEEDDPGFIENVLLSPYTMVIESTKPTDFSFSEVTMINSTNDDLYEMLEKMQVKLTVNGEYVGDADDVVSEFESILDSLEYMIELWSMTQKL